MAVGSDAPHLDGYVLDLVACKAHELVGKHGFTEDERRDIQHELLVDVLHRLRSFDPSRASFHTFADRVVDHGAARLIQRREAMRRDHRRCVCSLDDPVLDRNGTEVTRGELQDRESCRPGRSQPGLPVADLVVLRVSLARLRETLPPELRMLLDRLEQGQTIEDIWHQTGIPRGTLWGHLKRLRKLAQEAGLKD